MPVHVCSVSFRDLDGITHSVEVGADSLYEAVALALRIFKSKGLTEIQIHKTTELVVAVRPASVEHRLTVGKFRDWLGSTNRSPADLVRKARLRELLDQE